MVQYMFDERSDACALLVTIPVIIEQIVFYKIFYSGGDKIVFGVLNHNLNTSIT